MKQRKAKLAETGPTIRRREWMAGAAALATSLPTVAQTAAHVHAATDAAADAAGQAFASADAQPQLDHARRVFAALARLGEPVAAPDVSAIKQLANEGRLSDAATAVRLLQARVLATVVVTPEARAALVQGGWRLAAGPGAAARASKERGEGAMVMR